MSDLAKARAHLTRRDAVLASAIRRVGTCTLTTNSDHFGVLAKSILSQQISVKAADTIINRVIAACGRSGLTARRLQKLDDPDLREAGVSASKLLSLRSLADYFVNNSRLLSNLTDMSDQEVVDTLLPIRGVGVWTAQMFLIFALGRRDVLPVADLGFRMGVQDLYQLPELPSEQTLRDVSEPWAPYRSIGTWYIWQARDRG